MTYLHNQDNVEWRPAWPVASEQLQYPASRTPKIAYGGSTQTTD